MSIADLSKQLEKSHRRYSCLIYIFPPGDIGAGGHSQRDGAAFVPTAQQPLRLQLQPRARPSPPAPWWVRSHEPTLPSCDHSRASNLSPFPVHQRGTGLLSKINTSSRHEKDRLFIELCKSQKLLVEFSRSLSTQGNSCSSLGTARPQVCPITYKRDSVPPSTLPLP